MKNKGLSCLYDRAKHIAIQRDVDFFPFTLDSEDSFHLSCRKGRLIFISADDLSR